MTWPSGDPNHPYGSYPPPPPPPLPYQAYGQPQPPPEPPKKSRKGLIIALSVVGALVVIGVAVVAIAGFLLRDRVVASDVTVGSCIAEVPSSSRVVSLPTVDCSEPHGGEVYAVLEMPDGDYPGAAALGEWQSRCPDALAGYASSEQIDKTVGVYVLYPTQETWDAGDRAVTCVATLDPKRTGSLRG